MLSMIKRIGVDYVKWILMNTYPLTTLYDIREELKKENCVIILSSDIKVAGSASKAPSVIKRTTSIF